MSYDTPKHESIAWGVMWDTAHDLVGPVRHLVYADKGRQPGVALFWTRKEAEAYARDVYGFTLDAKNRKAPDNFRLPKPVRVRITVEPINPGRGVQRHNRNGE